jgi:RNA polymerase sigma-70 factor (ECF subfamily)
VTELDLRQVIDEHFARIHRAALILAGNPWDADDLAQETFLVVARQGDSFAGRSSVYTWLYGILLNLERRGRRQNTMRRHKLHVLWGDESKRGASVPAAETPIEVAEWKASVWSLVARLPDAQRHVLLLRFSEKLSYDEIAAVMQCPLGTVKSRIFHGLESLRRMLEAEGREIRAIPKHPFDDDAHAV